MERVPFQIENGIDDVFQHLRAGNGPLLGYVSHQEDGTP
jgi:hypothetical protein